MGRPLRRHEPGQFYLVTTRCHQARFLLRPDSSLNSAVLEWLSRAQQRFPGIRIFAVCVLSNHLHLVVRDDEGELAAWASYFFGHLARAVNRLRKRTGACFARRYSAEPILDHEALLDRIVYVVANPVKAGLCKRARDWPGVVLYAKRDPQQVQLHWLDRDRFRLERLRAIRRGMSAPKRDSFAVRRQLTIDALEPMSEAGDGTERVAAAIEARERELAEERRLTGRRARTRKQVLAQNWRERPRRPKRSPRPLCHTTDPNLRGRFEAGFSEFVSLFRTASTSLRAGVLDVSFPEWCYPPGRSLVRVTGDTGARPRAG
jgi:REP element-mobilizing transposase RayT